MGGRGLRLFQDRFSRGGGGSRGLWGLVCPAAMSARRPVSRLLVGSVLLSIACATGNAGGPKVEVATAEETRAAMGGGAVSAAAGASAGATAGASAGAAVPQEPTGQPPKLRLPAGARPIKYAVELSLNPESDTFSGDLYVEIEITRQQPVLWLNATELQVNKAELRLGSEHKALRVVDGGKDFVGLADGAPLEPGKLNLHLVYSGPVSKKDGRGVFRQREGKDWYVQSHFEAIDARRAFPCFDEPGFKTPWQLTLRVPKGQGAFSNTQPESDETKGEERVVRFGQTLPLPSYLVAFGVGPFERVDAGKLGPTAVGILALKGKGDRVKYAAQMSPKILSALEDWFGSPYPYGKMDSIAVPTGGGAMEHPGLVTFGYQLLQARPEDDSPSFRRRSTSVTAHEFAHQWFGDLVTTAWWDDIWLNEAFATWMTPKALEKVEPSWPNAEMRVATRATALNADSLQSARRVRQPIESNDDIANAFDAVTYQKGATVISMFERWVGPERFQKGVQAYLKAHRHGNATAADFLSAIAAEAGDRGPGLPEAFFTFLDQPGAPLISAKVRCEQGKPARLELTQERYRKVGAEDGAAQTWRVPICARWESGKVAKSGCTLLTEATGELPLGEGCPAWILSNDAMAGYYRADPGEQALETLLTSAPLSAAERAALLGDVRALVDAGRLPYAHALAWVGPAAHHENRAVVEAAMALVAPLREDRLLPEETQPLAASFIRDTFGKAAREIGWKPQAGEDDEKRLLRPSLLRLVGEDGEDPELGKQARALVETWLTDKSSLQADVVGPALTIAAATSDAALFDKLLAAAKATPERADRTRLLGALGRFRQPELLQRALGLTLTDDFDPRETAFVLRGVAQRPRGAQLAFEFVKANLAAIEGHMPRNFAAGIPSMFVSLCDDAKAQEIEAAFGDAAKKASGGPRRLTQAIEALHSCAAFRKAQAGSAAQFLKDRPKVTAAR